MSEQAPQPQLPEQPHGAAVEPVHGDLRDPYIVSTPGEFNIVTDRRALRDETSQQADKPDIGFGFSGTAPDRVAELQAQANSDPRLGASTYPSMDDAPLLELSGSRYGAGTGPHRDRELDNSLDSTRRSLQTGINFDTLAANMNAGGGQGQGEDDQAGKPTIGDLAGHLIRERDKAEAADTDRGFIVTDKRGPRDTPEDKSVQPEEPENPEASNPDSGQPASVREWFESQGITAADVAEAKDLGIPLAEFMQIKRAITAQPQQGSPEAGQQGKKEDQDQQRGQKRGRRGDDEQEGQRQVPKEDIEQFYKRPYQVLQNFYARQGMTVEQAYAQDLAHRQERRQPHVLSERRRAQAEKKQASITLANIEVDHNEKNHSRSEMDWTEAKDSDDERVYDTENHIYGVFDGEGEEGGKASEAAAAAIKNTLQEQSAPQSVDEALEQMREAFESARQEIEDQNPDGFTSATVVRLFELDGKVLAVVGQAGTSQLLGYEGGQVVQVTHAQTREMGKDVHPTHGIRPSSISHVDVEPGFEALSEDQFGVIEITPGRRLVLCTDGVTAGLTDMQLDAMMSHRHVEELAKYGLLRSKGNRDDKTLIAIGTDEPVNGNDGWQPTEFEQDLERVIVDETSELANRSREQKPIPHRVKFEGKGLRGFYTRLKWQGWAAAMEHSDGPIVTKEEADNFRDRMAYEFSPQSVIDAIRFRSARYDEPQSRNKRGTKGRDKVGRVPHKPFVRPTGRRRATDETADIPEQPIAPAPEQDTTDLYIDEVNRELRRLEAEERRKGSPDDTVHAAVHESELLGDDTAAFLGQTALNQEEFIDLGGGVQWGEQEPSDDTEELTKTPTFGAAAVIEAMKSARANRVPKRGRRRRQKS